MEWRIFFIGPMSGKNGIDRHIPMLRGMVVRYLRNQLGYQPLGEEQRRQLGWDAQSQVLDKELDRLVLITPSEQELRGNISRNVFHQIDNADLVIADLTEHRPAVIYELALAHSLGVDTIFVRRRAPPGEKFDESGNFYLNPTRYAEVDFDEAAEIPDQLRNDLDAWLRTRHTAAVASNPLSDFYEAPLFDISAASGLASGFFFNFASPILAEGQIVQRQAKRGLRFWPLRPAREAVRPLKGLIVLRPEQLTQRVNELQPRLEATLIASFGAQRVLAGKEEQLFIRIRGGTRTPFFVVEDYFVDIPRTLFSLEHSPRYNRAQKALSQVPANLQKALIQRFFDNLKRLFLSHGKMFDMDHRFHVGSIEEIPLIIRTGKSRTWIDERPREWDE